MSLFQHRIKPEWEDEVNKNGGTLQINFKTNLPFLQTLWQKLVFSVVTDTFENADMIAGIRLLDKSVMGRENMFRFEIWTKFDNTQQILVESLQQHLIAEYIQPMMNEPGTRPVDNKAREEVPADWLGQLKNNCKDDNAKSYPPRGPPQNRGGHG